MIGGQARSAGSPQSGAGRKGVGRPPDRLASAQREAWGVGGRGMAAERRQCLRAVAGAEATASCAYSRGFQIRA